MILFALTALTAAALLVAAGRSPLGRTIGAAMNSLADAPRGQAGSLD